MIPRELASRIAGLDAGRVPYVLATVVAARRPTSVRAGDRGVVLADGSIEGFVGGVCAEASVRLHALRALETGEPLLLRLLPGDAGDGAGVPGSGGAGAGGAGAGAGGTVEGAVVEHNPCLSGGTLEIFLEPCLPPPRVVVVGDAPIARAVEKVASAAGFEALRGRAGEVEAASGDAALIVASHGAGEEQVISEALARGVPYVALVASAVRGAAVRDALAVPEELRAQLHTPAGLSIGARTPGEVALSILAELVSSHHAQPVEVVRQAVDPVCGMTVAVTDATPSAEGEYFCGERCREAYVEQHAAT